MTNENNQVIGFKWLMSFTKGWIIRENPNLIPGWNNFLVRFYLPRDRTLEGPFEGTRGLKKKIKTNEN
jgi:hypothetical protein